MTIGEVLAACAPDFPDDHDLEDPLPRGRGPDRARAHPVGLPQVLRRGHRAAALHPPAAARPLPAAAGDQGAPRRASTAAWSRRVERRRPTVPRWRWPPTGCPAPESFRRRDDVRLSRRELVKTAEITEELLDRARAATAWSRPRAGTEHYDADALVIAKAAR